MHENVSSGWEKIRNGVPQGSILDPLFFLIYINDLLMVTDNDSKVVLLAHDTSTIITSPNEEGLQIALNKTLSYYNLHISHILIASRNCLNISCYVGPYAGGFCSCGLARLLVTGGTTGVVASSLLERGEFGGS